jgi:hypothetical protein
MNGPKSDPDPKLSEKSDPDPNPKNIPGSTTLTKIHFTMHYTVVYTVQSPKCTVLSYLFLLV